MQCVPNDAESSKGRASASCTAAFDELVRARLANTTLASPRKDEKSFGVDGTVMVHYSRAPCRRRSKVRMLQHHGLPWDEVRGQLFVAEYLDVEDLSALGRATRACPFYGARALAAAAEVVLVQEL